MERQHILKKNNGYEKLCCSNISLDTLNIVFREFRKLQNFTPTNSNLQDTDRAKYFFLK